MITDIVNIARTLFGLKGDLEKARRDRRDRIADYFDAISRTVAEVAASLRQREVPHGKCAEMRTYADQLVETVGDEIGQQKAEPLAEQLKDAHEVELLLSEVYGATDAEEKLAQLEEASGLFKATATSIRAAA